MAYNIEAGFTPFSDTGLATIYFGTDKERADECLELIDLELTKIRSGKLSDRLLHIAKKQYLGQITIAMENNESYMLSAARSFLVYNNIDAMETIREKIGTVTRDEIVAGCQRDLRDTEPFDAHVPVDMDDLERYIERHVTPEDPLLAELDRETHLRVVQPRMISGHLQGRLLEMVVRMIRPQRILEIGTFTGYSAICMARGLDEGGELHTIEANDELEPIASKYFIRSGLSGRITLHIGSALDIAPSLGVFDLIFIDGDKREYPQYYDMALSHLVRSGSYLLADNILWYGKVAETVPVGDRHTWAIREFNDRVLQDDRVENVILPIRDGLNLIRVK